MALYCKIKKDFGSFVLDVDFSAEDEVLALIGASGSGKSMTLKCIAGIVKPDSGRIVLNDRVLFDSEKKINLSPQKRKVGLLFQDYALFPNMTVAKNISLGLPKEERTPERISALIKQFNLDGLDNHFPSQLSGGQKQRCAIARIMASEPDIIMLDEPFSALDSFLRWKLENEVYSEMKRFGRTVLLVSHNRDEVYRMCDRVAVISNGKNERVRTKQELFFSPESYDDALLTGCKNIYEGSLDGNLVTIPNLNISFTTNEIPPYKVEFVGFRAKKLVPEFEKEDGKEYIPLKYKVISETENVFTYVLMIEIEGGKEPFRWEVQKEVYERMKGRPQVVEIPMDEIMLLHK